MSDIYIIIINDVCSVYSETFLFQYPITKNIQELVDNFEGLEGSYVEIFFRVKPNASPKIWNLTLEACAHPVVYTTSSTTTTTPFVSLASFGSSTTTPGVTLESESYTTTPEVSVESESYTTTPEVSVESESYTTTPGVSIGSTSTPRKL